MYSCLFLNEGSSRRIKLQTIRLVRLRSRENPENCDNNMARLGRIDTVRKSSKYGGCFSTSSSRITEVEETNFSQNIYFNLTFLHKRTQQTDVFGCFHKFSYEVTRKYS